MIELRLKILGREIGVVEVEKDDIGGETRVDYDQGKIKIANSLAHSQKAQLLLKAILVFVAKAQLVGENSLNDQQLTSIATGLHSVFIDNSLDFVKLSNFGLDVLKASPASRLTKAFAGNGETQNKKPTVEENNE